MKPNLDRRRKAFNALLVLRAHAGRKLQFTGDEVNVLEDASAVGNIGNLHWYSLNSRHRALAHKVIDSGTDLAIWIEFTASVACLACFFTHLLFLAISVGLPCFSFEVLGKEEVGLSKVEKGPASRYIAISAVFAGSAS